MRLFIALNFDGLQEYFQELQKQIEHEEVRFTFPQSFHLTLKFLGDLNDKDVAQVRELLKGVSFTPYQTVTKEIGVFPSEQYLRTIWVSIEDTETAALQKRIEEALRGIGKKTKGFKAHITIARVKHIHPDKKKSFVEQLKRIKTKKIAVGVNKFYLIKSVLTPEGSAYEVIEEYPVPL